MEDVARHGDHAERVDGGVEQTIHLQRRTQIPHNADPDTAHYTSPSLKVNRMVPSSKHSETSSETRSAERPGRITVNERQLDRVPGRKSGAASVDDATIVKNSVPLVRSRFVHQNTLPRRAATVNPSEFHMTPGRTRATTVYNVVGVEMDRSVVGRWVM